MLSDRSHPTTPWSTLPIDLLDPKDMAEADRIAGARVPSRDLMTNAGTAVAHAALRLIEGERRVFILCGPGNNGGDGYVAARLLEASGCDVTCASLVASDTLAGDAAWAASLWHGRTVDPADVTLDGADLVVDALFGAGLSRDIDGAAKALIERVNTWAARSGRPLLAVDVPSGVDGASGQIRGAAIVATETVTFFRLKPGHVLLPGRDLCGALALADIGIGADVLVDIGVKTFLNQTALWRAAMPVPTLAGHKYARGHALVVSGPVAQTGAARLCARGALRAGAGLVTVATPADALVVHATALTAIMTKVADDADGLAALLTDPRKNAVVLGPGLGVGGPTRDKVRATLASPGSADGRPRGIVLDADALVSFADEPNALFEAILRGAHAVVLTPHDGEFAKLFGGVLDVGAAKLARTREAARLAGAVVVLKGSDTTVAHPDGRASIAASDAPWLATAGSGDVLAGIITGLLAQGMPSFESASAAVWMHAEAASLFGPGLIAEDLPDMLPRVFRSLLAGPGRGREGSIARV